MGEVSHLKPVIDRKHDAESRKAEVLAMLEQAAEDIRSGELDVSDAVLIMADFSDPDRIASSRSWTCRPQEVMLLTRIIQSDIDRQLGL